MATHLCGLYSIGARWYYLPLVDVDAHATLLSTTSKTTLTQTYRNPPQNGHVQELRYTFPLYDGVSVVAFSCRIGDRTIVGQVKERERAKKVFAEAVARGENAALLEQLPQASDVFTTTVGNIPAGARVIIEITYLGELKHDAEVDGVRFTIPTTVMPRYGDHPVHLARGATECVSGGRAQITVDIVQDETSFIQQIKSPSHLLAVSLGTTSDAPNADPIMSKASATLSLESASLDKDFVVQVVAKNSGFPTAMLETHPTIPNQQALMVTLVPKFSLPPERPELVFLVDRSGSMVGTRISLVKSAMKVFLKSIPIGVKFNICSFGSSFSYLWRESQAYTQSTLDEAIQHVDSMQANFGGTEMYQPIEATLKQRFKDLPLEIMLLTDGEIWDQERLFKLLNNSVSNSVAPIRVFTLGIGNGVSHSLIEGIAKAGNGFSQSVGEEEKMGSKLVRMLKGALSPHVTDYTLEVKYADEDAMTDVGDDDFELVEKVTDSLNVRLSLAETEPPQPEEKKPISLFDTSVDLDKEAPSPADDDSGAARYSHLPPLAAPKLLQVPSVIPPLYAFNRTTVYLLMDPKCSQKRPKSVVLRGTSTHGPLELEISIQILDTPGETIHQLAAKKAISELEQGRGWMAQAKDESGELISSKNPGRFSEMVEREAVRLGVLFQVGGKWCSFVAVENEDNGEKAKVVELLSVPSNPAPTGATSDVAQVHSRSFSSSTLPRSAPRAFSSMASQTASASRKGRASPRALGYSYAAPRREPDLFGGAILMDGTSPMAFGSSVLPSVHQHQRLDVQVLDLGHQW
ncbi:hypothetical protein BGZ67_006224 [Mortierella alpina]|nr:hypothetical protein BGZ67_006224 [Mortierella alpina]